MVRYSLIKEGYEKETVLSLIIWMTDCHYTRDRRTKTWPVTLALSASQYFGQNWMCLSNKNKVKLFDCFTIVPVS